MGLLAPVVEFLLLEHAFRKIEGDVLFVGRQTTFLDQHSLKLLLDRHGIIPAQAGEPEIDTATWGGRQGRFITDRYLMKVLGVKNLRFMDVSNYEGADIVCDLGHPVDESLHGKFDFIYNGGCLDNMFNPAGALANFTRMLKPGGRVVCMESASSYNTPYLMYSPGWFFDYYVMNGFSDCKIYVCSYTTVQELLFGPWDLFHFDWPLNKDGPAPEARHNHLLLLTVAEKGADSTADVQPIQHQYRLDPTVIARFENNLRKFSESKRPLVNSRNQEATPSVRTLLTRITDRLGLSLYRAQPYLRRLGKFALGIPRIG